MDEWDHPVLHRIGRAFRAGASGALLGAGLLWGALDSGFCQPVFFDGANGLVSGTVCGEVYIRGNVGGLVYQYFRYQPGTIPGDQDIVGFVVADGGKYEAALGTKEGDPFTGVYVSDAEGIIYQLELSPSGVVVNP